ncbi:hypothetical protein [Nonomuraea guangzhouensis]|uniref:Uncharacterized protein n=1 Tax=Nonomuraea guangzhouensis TaxID=1291555 RepID=A0ABW4GUK2_9ACTN|nr:hypothetical protein [Nonomuraea guangzhouensis]
MNDLSTALPWMRQGSDRLLTLVEKLTDDDFHDQPPAWLDARPRHRACGAQRRHLNTLLVGSACRTYKPAQPLGTARDGLAGRDRSAISPPVRALATLPGLWNAVASGAQPL